MGFHKTRVRVIAPQFELPLPFAAVDETTRRPDRVRALRGRVFGAEARLAIAEGERDQALAQLRRLRRGLYDLWRSADGW